MDWDFSRSVDNVDVLINFQGTLWKIQRGYVTVHILAFFNIVLVLELKLLNPFIILCDIKLLLFPDQQVGSINSV